MSDALENIKKRFSEIQARYEEWVAPIKKVDLDNMYRINRDGYTFDDYQAAIELVRQKQFAKYNPYEESYPVIEEICSIYLDSDEEQRAEIREMVLISQFWTWDAPMNFMRSKIDELKANPDGNILRMALAAASIQNCSVDYRDVVVILHDMFKAAESVGIDPIPYFTEIAELSSEQLPLGGSRPMKVLINNFCNRSDNP